MEHPMSNAVHPQPAADSLEQLCSRLLRISTVGDIHDALLVINELNAHSLINQFPEQIYIKDRRSRFVLANASTARSHNLDSPTNLLGKTDFDFFQQEAAEELFLA